MKNVVDDVKNDQFKKPFWLAMASWVLKFSIDFVCNYLKY